MKKLFFSLCAGAALFLTSCAAVQSPIGGMFYTDIKAPITATSNSGSSKVGTAKATGYVGLIAIGDASIETAAKEGSISKIHHVDYHSNSILGIINTFTVTVYGE